MDIALDVVAPAIGEKIREESVARLHAYDQYQMQANERKKEREAQAKEKLGELDIEAIQPDIGNLDPHFQKQATTLANEFSAKAYEAILNSRNTLEQQRAILPLVNQIKAELAPMYQTSAQVSAMKSADPNTLTPASKAFLNTWQGTGSDLSAFDKQWGVGNTLTNQLNDVTWDTNTHTLRVNRNIDPKYDLEKHIEGYVKGDEGNEPVFGAPYKEPGSDQELVPMTTKGSPEQIRGHTNSAFSGNGLGSKMFYKFWDEGGKDLASVREENGGIDLDPNHFKNPNDKSDPNAPVSNLAKSYYNWIQGNIEPALKTKTQVRNLSTLSFADKQRLMLEKTKATQAGNELRKHFSVIKSNLESAKLRPQAQKSGVLNELTPDKLAKIDANDALIDQLKTTIEGIYSDAYTKGVDLTEADKMIDDNAEVKRLKKQLNDGNVKLGDFKISKEKPKTVQEIKVNPYE